MYCADGPLGSHRPREGRSPGQARRAGRRRAASSRGQTSQTRSSHTMSACLLIPRALQKQLDLGLTPCFCARHATRLPGTGRGQRLATHHSSLACLVNAAQAYDTGMSSNSCVPCDGAAPPKDSQGRGAAGSNGIQMPHAAGTLGIRAYGLKAAELLSFVVRSCHHCSC